MAASSVVAEVDPTNNNLTTSAQEEPNSLLSDSVAQTKLLASLILFTMTMICGYLPVKTLLNQNYVQHAMFAGGGVLMATAFCHLIPEAHDNYKLSTQTSSSLHTHSHSHSHSHIDHSDLDHEASNLIANETTTTTTTTTTILINNNASIVVANETTPAQSDQAPNISSLNVPYLEITLCCGFFFMYLVEALMIRFINTHTHEHPCLDTSASQLMVNGTGDTASHCQTDAASATGGSETLIIGPQVSGDKPIAAADTITQLSASSTTLTNLASGAIVDGVIIVGSTNAPSDKQAKLKTRKRKSASASGKLASGSTVYKFVRGLLIVSAFGAHAIFDGVAIGSQESVEKVWTLFLAITCHKLIIAAVVGLELFSATLESHLWTLVHLAIFSVMSPLGIILVVIAQNSFHVDSTHPTMILLQSFATGTLLYIVFVEILQPKSDQVYEKNQFGKSFSLIAGFALMLMVLTLIGD